MTLRSLRHFVTNIICGLIPGKTYRKKVRVILNSDLLRYIKFIRYDINEPIKKIKTFVGYRGSNLLISVNNKYIYKFPCRHNDNNERAIREYKIVSALGNKFNIHAPSMQLVQHNGLFARRYAVVSGTNHRSLPDADIRAHYTEYGREIARFLFDMGCADPVEIADLKAANNHGEKTSINLTPGFMRGWCHNDLEDNIIIDPHTLKIIAIIDWEDACYMDFSNIFNINYPGHWRPIMDIARQEYIRLYTERFGSTTN